MKEKKIAYIIGPRNEAAMEEAAKFLATMGYYPVNPMKFIKLHPDASWEEYREMRLDAVEASDIVFMMDGWQSCPEAVDEWETWRLYNEEHDRKIGSSFPELRH